MQLSVFVSSWTYFLTVFGFFFCFTMQNEVRSSKLFPPVESYVVHSNISSRIFFCYFKTWWQVFGKLILRSSNLGIPTLLLITLRRYLWIRLISNANLKFARVSDIGNRSYLGSSFLTLGWFYNCLIFTRLLMMRGKGFFFHFVFSLNFMQKWNQ